MFLPRGTSEVVNKNYAYQDQKIQKHNRFYLNGKKHLISSIFHKNESKFLQLR